MSEINMEMSTRAYCKLIMHSAKYPSSRISGLLLARREDMSGGRKTRFVDSIPLFHMNDGLSPMVEVALSQVESEAEESGLVIAGYYHAHDNIRDNHIDPFSQKIADKICENQAGSVLVTLDSKRLSANIDTPSLILHQNVDGKWKQRDKGNWKVEQETATLSCASDLIGQKAHRNLVDFDNHLDDISKDYLNVELNMKIDSLL